MDGKNSKGSPSLRVTEVTKDPLGTEHKQTSLRCTVSPVRLSVPSHDWVYGEVPSCTDLNTSCQSSVWVDVSRRSTLHCEKGIDPWLSLQPVLSTSKVEQRPVEIVRSERGLEERFNQRWDNSECTSSWRRRGNTTKRGVRKIFVTRYYLWNVGFQVKLQMKVSWSDTVSLLRYRRLRVDFETH